MKAMAETINPEEYKEARVIYQRVFEKINKVMIGFDRPESYCIADQLLTCFFLGEHVLLEGVPGTGKTQLALSLRKAAGLDYRRVQCTPDLMPADITGTYLPVEYLPAEKRNDKDGGIQFSAGPIFANILHVDEINRTTPKTQSALLEAMEERKVTILGITHDLPFPFFVIATMNPIEMEGTYPLPEAQIDRFLLKIEIENPDDDAHLRITRKAIREKTPSEYVEPAFSSSDEALGAIAKVKKVINGIKASDEVIMLAIQMTNKSRRHPKVRYGAGIRGSRALVLAAKALAFFKEEVHVTSNNLLEVAKPVLRHRIGLRIATAGLDVNPADGVVDEIITQI